MTVGLRTPPITGQQFLEELRGHYCPAADCYALCDALSCRCRPCRCMRCRARTTKALRARPRPGRKPQGGAPVWAPQARLFNPSTTRR